MFIALLATNVITLIGFFMSADIDSILNKRSNAINIAYEDRIFELRQEVDRLYSRQYAQAGDLNLQIQELSQKQAALSELHPYIKALALKAQELGVKDIASNLPPNPSIKSNQSDNITTGSISLNKNSNQAYITQIEQSITQMHDESEIALANLTNSANKSTSVILYELKQVGIAPIMPEYDEQATGGPFLPANNRANQQSLINEANQVVLSLDRFIAAKKAISISPVFSPLKKGYRISSSYGNRKDPILGTKAFHSGTDMAAPRGTSVFSAGDGIVTFAGRNGGYGKVVEIKHDGGLVTKYAHLNSYSVVKGQRVKAGSIIAKVGSTGRSTGPHLHFEVKNANGTLSSTRFLIVGKKLAQFM